MRNQKKKMKTYQRCKRCKNKKPLSKFYSDKRQPNGISLYCKKCQKECSKNWNAAHPKYSTNYQRERSTGCSVERYNELFKEQDGCCAICDKPQHEQKKQMAVDHDHGTGQIRGLLCPSCNVGLGLFKDDLELFERAMGYLMETKDKDY